MADLEERLDALERTVAFMLDALAETAEKAHLRLLALQQVLEQKGLVTNAEVTVKMQAISDYAENQVEFSDDPEVKRFRELRRLIQEQDDPEEGGDDRGPHR